MNETIKLSPRQKVIINLLALKGNINRQQITSQINPVFDVSKATVARDLALLVNAKLVEADGGGAHTKYKIIQFHPLLAYVDLEHYFAEEADERKHAKTNFDSGVFSKLAHLFSKNERQDLDIIYRSFSESTKALDRTIVAKELERFLVEFSWKSSKIEGNTYTLLETESLITQGQRASGRTNGEAQMILNHKDAFKTIVDYKDSFKKLSIVNIIEIHKILTSELGINNGIRKHAVGITGTTYRPLDNEWQIRDAVEEMIDVVNKTSHPLEKALLTMTLIAYIQPFVDGNKRTARTVANGLLLAYDFFPLSYRSISEREYKNALILFYETNNLYYIKRLFLEQYRFALKNYFVI